MDTMLASSSTIRILLRRSVTLVTSGWFEKPSIQSYGKEEQE
jgi:hypothetical protein